MKNLPKSSETGKPGPLELKAAMCHYYLDPKLIPDYIDLWHKDPNTPLPEMNLTPGQSHVLTAFIEEEKWKFEEGRRLKKA